MNPKLLKLKPKRYLCPYCGEWHEWELNYPLEDYDGEEWEIYDSWEGEYVVSTGVADLRCPNDLEDYDDRHIYFRFKEGKCYFKTFSECDSKKEIDSRILINDIVESDKKPRVIFHVPFTSETEVNNMSCEDCGSKDVCIVCKLGEKNDGYHMEIPFGFEFDKDDYMRYSNVWRLAHEQALKEQRQNARKWASQNGQRNKQAGNCQEQVTEATQPKDKEETTMGATMKTSIISQLYEKSPKENIETIKAWAEQYKPVLQWAVPVAAVYGAYRILNSGEFDLSVNNIAETCEKQLGFKVELLENKKALKELMVIGGLSAGAYGALKIISGIFGENEKKDVSVEELEDGMSQLENVSKKFAWIQPKTEDMLPIALSVILVYIALHKPNASGKIAGKVSNFAEDVKIRFETYFDLAKLFVQDKFNMDLSNDKDQKKLRICGFLVASLAIFAILYGKKVLETKSDGEEESEEGHEKSSKTMESFAEQAKKIIAKIAPTMYTTLITFLVSKKILMLEDSTETLVENGNNEEAPSEPASATDETMPGVAEEEQEGMDWAKSDMSANYQSAQPMQPSQPTQPTQDDF